MRRVRAIRGPSVLRSVVGHPVGRWDSPGPQWLVTFKYRGEEVTRLVRNTPWFDALLEAVDGSQSAELLSVRYRDVPEFVDATPATEAPLSLDFGGAG